MIENDWTNQLYRLLIESVKFHGFSVKFHWLESWEVTESQWNVLIHSVKVLLLIGSVKTNEQISRIGYSLNQWNFTDFQSNFTDWNREKLVTENQWKCPDSFSERTITYWISENDWTNQLNGLLIESVKIHWFSFKFDWLESWEHSHRETVKMYRFIQWKDYYWLNQWKQLHKSVVRITLWISEINHF